MDNDKERPKDIIFDPPEKIVVPKKIGRPPKIIDWNMVEKLSNLHCTQEEIANALGNITVRSLQRKAEFRRIYKKGMDAGKMSLRRWQLKSAKAGSTTMQIWLGKQWLGQRDIMEIENDHKVNIKISIGEPDE